MLLYTPETSGGLLIAVPEKMEKFTALFDREGQSYWVVGRVVEGEGIEVG